jgi:hypothetical protein
MVTRFRDHCFSIGGRALHHGCMRNSTGFIIAGVLVLCVGLLAPGCTRETDPPYLLRVGDSTITVEQFRKAVDSACEEVLAGEGELDGAALHNIRAQVLNQLTEELLIAQKAKSLGITVSDAEVDHAVDAIRADYPDNTFEETLLESAVTFEHWRQKLSKRLLVEKVITTELVDKVEITSQDVDDYYKSNYPEGPPAEEDPNTFNQKVVRHLRRQKAELDYQPWIDGLRKIYPVDINKNEWERLLGKS